MCTKPRILVLVVSTLLAIALFPGIAFVEENGLIVGSANMTTQAASDHTADDAINWAKSKVGTSVGYNDGSGYYQCVEFIQAYYQYLGVSPVTGNGCDYASNALPAGWTRTAGGQPQKGDILVYGAYGSQAYGHVAIYESDNSLYDQDGSVYGATVKHETANYRTYTWAYWGCIHPNFGSFVNHDPGGGFDECWSDDGLLGIRGWSFDPDSPDTAVRIHVYVGGPAGSGASCYTTDAVGKELIANNQDRPDAGRRCGFYYTLSVEETGEQPIYVYALDNEGGNNPLLVGSPRIVSIPDSGSNPSPSAKASVEAASIAGINSKTYTGKALTQAPTVKLGSTVLTAGTDYTLSYANNVKAGIATVTVTGKGNYTGSKSATFSIVAASSGSGSSSSAPEGSSDGNGGSATPPSEPGAVVAAALKMHRLYNPNSYEHFYTGDDAEAANLVSLGWNDEGVAWYGV